jgi:uncharacterized membrane protein YgcG
MLKKAFLLLFFLLGSFVFSCGGVVAESYDESIAKFIVDIEINEDASILVTEKILYDFGENERHGIFRDIPVVYGDDTILVDFDFYSVTDENGNEYEYEVFDYFYSKRLKIGDPDEYLTGEHWYYITYSVDNFVNGFLDYDELFWNITGNFWEVPIYYVEAHVFTPSGGSSEGKSATCYTGEFGYAYKDCSYSVVSDDEIVYKSSSTLHPYQGMSIVAGFEKGFVDLPAVLHVSRDPAGANLYLDGKYNSGVGFVTLRLDEGSYSLEFKKFKYVSEVIGVDLKAGEVEYVQVVLEKSVWAPFWEFYLPLGVLFAGILIAFLLWWYRGRDDEGRGTIMPIYDVPENLTPGEVGVLCDERVHLHDITACILNFAVKGYLNIKKTEKDRFLWGKDYDFSFVKVKDPLEGELKSYEKRIFDGIFYSKDVCTVKLKTLEKKFCKSLPKIKEELYNCVLERGYFSKDPEKAVSNYKWVSLGVFIFVFLFDVFLGIYAESAWYLLLFLLPIVFFVLSYLMPKKTKVGRLDYEKVLGFKMFLKATQKDRLEVLFSPKEYQGLFEKCLPYAIVFGIEDKWASQFKGLYEDFPSWYVGSGSFVLHDFVGEIGAFSSIASKTFIHSSGEYGAGWGGGFATGGSSDSSGFSGGFSGGGGGGGGGGSW